MPPGGDGFYYFSTYLLGDDDQYGFFNIEINGDILCTVVIEQEVTDGDALQSACSTATYAVEGRI